ncbi:hypothetical protein ACIQU3_25825 [Streptomyces sp. NPDC101110]|uniref:hypothetical protein n=1 Tax=unclassified Streptomyces TaxID=2593676 RepID=UPI00381939DB
MSGLMAVGGAGQAAAHDDTISFRVEPGHGGRVLMLATYENDKDPVTQKLTGTLIASATDGHTAGPWQLVPVRGTPGAYTTVEALPPGRWWVTVRSAFPELGYGEGRVRISAAKRRAAPTQRGTPSPAVALGTTAQGRENYLGGVGLVTGGVAATACVGVLLALRRRRSQGG